MQVDPHRLAPLGDRAVRVLDQVPHRLGLAQLGVLADVVQEEVEGRPADLGRPLPLGLVELDVHFAVLDRQLADEQLPQDFV